jgi:hypothetical protein
VPRAKSGLQDKFPGRAPLFTRHVGTPSTIPLAELQSSYPAEQAITLRRALALEAAAESLRLLGATRRRRATR